MVLLLAIATISLTAYGPLLMQRLHGASPIVAGYVVALESAAWTVAAIATAGAGARMEPWLIRAGGGLIALGVAGFAAAMPTGGLVPLAACALLQGTGFGMAWTFVLRRIVGAAPVADQARLTSALPTVQLLGYAIGSALAGVVANSLGLADDASRTEMERVGFWVFAAFVPVAMGGAWAALRLAAGSKAAAA
jgi:hypothetical protein